MPRAACLNQAKTTDNSLREHLPRRVADQPFGLSVPQKPQSVLRSRIRRWPSETAQAEVKVAPSVSAPSTSIPTDLLGANRGLHPNPCFDKGLSYGPEARSGKLSKLFRGPHSRSLPTLNMRDAIAGHLTGRFQMLRVLRLGTRPTVTIRPSQRRHHAGRSRSDRRSSGPTLTGSAQPGRGGPGWSFSLVRRPSLDGISHGRLS
jgi:hypothetical protein